MSLTDYILGWLRWRLRHKRKPAARSGSWMDVDEPRTSSPKAAPLYHRRLTSTLYYSTHAPVMGGLTYGTYGAGSALTVIGLCTFGTQRAGKARQQEG